MIKAKFLSTIYTRSGKSGDTGYRIYRYQCIEGDDTVSNGMEFTAGGYYLPASTIPVYNLNGDWAEGKNGKSYKVISFSEEINNDKIIEYLSSGILKSVTPEYASKIAAKFGEKTLSILDNDPEKILNVGTIPISTLFAIKGEYEEERCIIPLLTWLNAFKVSEKTVRNVYKKEGGTNAIKAAKEDPYLLYRYGVSFQTCKKIASTLSLPTGYTGMEKAAALDVLKAHESTGDIAMPRKDFLEAYDKILKEERSSYAGDPERILSVFEKESDMIVPVQGHLYLRDTLQTENRVAKRVALLSKTKPSAKVNFNLQKEILAAEKRHGITLHVNQRNAIVTALTSSVTVITGGPGTGKTTVVKIMREIYENRMGKTMRFIAPTGRAAARMKESSGYDAYTIHKTLLINDDNLFDENAIMINEDAVVCDEASMLDIFVARKLFDAVQKGHQIVLLGDVNQLPSVGAGKVLNDLISSEVVSVAELTKVYRQSSISRIFLNCQKIVKGNTTLEEGEDFEVIESSDFDDSAKKMVNAYLEAVKKYGIDEVCCLCPFRRKTASGVDSLNKVLQEKINPQKSGLSELKYKGTVFRDGDRVMNRRNTSDACNGDIGYITKIDTSLRCISVKFPQGEMDYYYEDLEYLDLAYAMSIHKSQGSEFKCCIANFLPAHGVMLQMNLLNTAVSRAKEKFILVGDRKAVLTAISKRDGLKRLSALKPKLIYAKNKIA